MKMLKYLFYSFLILCLLVWMYTNSLIGVDPIAKEKLKELRLQMLDRGYTDSFFVLSGRRWKWDNYLLNQFGGAAKNSQHLQGKAIDIIVLDVNKDGLINGGDVDLVVKVLKQSVIKNKGGIGTYKGQSGFFNRQMVHFDVRGNKARWNR